MTDELVEAVEAAIRQALSDYAPWKAKPADFIEEAKVSARAAIRVIAPAVLEQAAKEADDRGCEFTGLREGVMFDQLARAIRALKEGYSHDQ